jgi:hypothetical protein
MHTHAKTGPVENLTDGIDNGSATARDEKNCNDRREPRNGEISTRLVHSYKEEYNRVGHKGRVFPENLNDFSAAV